MKNISYLNILGKGLFTTAYLQKDNKTVILKSTDYIKECMSLGWFPNSMYFPKVERLDQGIYKMKKYDKPKSLKNSLKPKQYEIYKELRNLSIGYIKNSYNNLDEWRKQFNTISNKTVKNALNDAIDACSNYGSDVCFEISPRNVAVSKTGNLILLDCFFIASQANDIRTSKRNK